MTRLLLTSAALVAIAMTGAANAADLPMPEPVYKAPPPIVYNWTGCYVGGGGGFGLWNQDANFQQAGVVTTATSTSGGRGWFGQGQAGCDYQFSLPLGSFWSPNVVIGAFGDYEWTGNSMRGSLTVPGLVSTIGAETMPWSWAAGARAGVLVTPKFLTYFDGGYTQANFSQVNLQLANGAPAGTFVGANTYNGWFIGSGFEYSFDFLPGLFFKTEFRYSTYNTANLPLLVAAPGAPFGAPPVSVNSTKYVEMVSTELVWRFNWFGH